MSNHVATLENKQRPYYHNHIKLLCKSTKGSKDFYDLLKTDKSTRDLRCLYKWETDLNISLHLNSWEKYTQNLFSIKDNSPIRFQYKIIYRLIGVKHYLHKLNYLPHVHVAFVMKMKKHFTFYLFHVKKALIFGVISKYR